DHRPLVQADAPDVRRPRRGGRQQPVQRLDERPLRDDVLPPDGDDRAAYEQPGCLHATMDLYKHAFRLTPMICSGLVADAFELAWDIRITDMRAAPYDLSGITLDPTDQPWTPIRIETSDGKAEYVALQRQFSERAAPIRQRLMAECERLLAASAVPATNQ
ncbi:MAG: hypothetical protein ACJ72P_02275, partial [Nocardioides sp.]